MLRLPTAKDNLFRYIEAGFPILYIYTFEESKADRYIENVASLHEVLEWNGANGFVNFKTKAPIIPSQTLETTLSFLKEGNGLHRKLLVIKDAADLLREPTENPEAKKVVALLKEIARKIRTGDGGIDSAVIIVSSSLHIPKALEKMITIMELDFPDEQEISKIIVEALKEQDRPTVLPELLEKMSIAFKGLTEYEVLDLLHLALSENHELTDSALKLIFEQKQQIILKAGILEMIPHSESVKNIGGLENLKEWLQRKAAVYKDMKSAKAFGVTTPKGVLIAGIPGCGKSLSAKAAGSLFGVPLLRLDMGRIMGRYVGESEENMRNAIRLAEAISPCVLWVDELEKALAGIGSGGGSEVTTRLFGAFLTWMQEKTSPVFVVATANEITKLPPELMRKGRFDEIFYVPLPKPEERKKIFEIHINKRRPKDLKGIDIDTLTNETNGYSGADIEGVIGESVESVFVKKNTALTTEDILNCIRNTHSLAEIMKDRLDEMDKEYMERKFKNASR